MNRRYKGKLVSLSTKSGRLYVGSGVCGCISFFCRIAHFIFHLYQLKLPYVWSASLSGPMHILRGTPPSQTHIHKHSHILLLSAALEGPSHGFSMGANTRCNLSVNMQRRIRKSSSVLPYTKL